MQIWITHQWGVGVVLINIYQLDFGWWGCTVYNVADQSSFAPFSAPTLSDVIETLSTF